MDKSLQKNKSLYRVKFIFLLVLLLIEMSLLGFYIAINIINHVFNITLISSAIIASIVYIVDFIFEPCGESYHDLVVVSQVYHTFGIYAIALIFMYQLLTYPIN